MTLLKKLVCAGLAAAAASALAVTGFSSKKSLKGAKADSTYTLTLDNTNSPALVGGSGTMLDEKGLLWEYSNASSYAEGHVTLNNGGYVGLSSSSPYGITGITAINTVFDSENELWLLKSLDGNIWSEECLLTSDQLTLAANNWRFIRLYNHSENNSQTAITSLTVTYSCSGVSAEEDTDGAKVTNVVQTSANLTASQELVELSPNSHGGEAVRFTKSNNSSSNLILGFGKNYTIGEIAYKKVEFDIQTSNINYGKTLQLMNGTGGVGSTIDSSKHSSYVITNIQDDWYHVEVPITALVSLISGYNGTDLPAKDIDKKVVNGIKINAGNCVIDNLRISGTPMELGIYNNYPTVALGSTYWLKASWTGILRSCTMTFDSPIAEQIPIDDPDLAHGSPFYVRALGTGTVNVTINIVSGYNSETHSLTRALKIN